MSQAEALCRAPPSSLSFSVNASPTSRQIKLGPHNAKRTGRGEMIYPKVIQLGHMQVFLTPRSMLLNMLLNIFHDLVPFGVDSELFCEGKPYSYGWGRPSAPWSLSREYNLKFMAFQCSQKSLAEENSFYGELPEGYEDHLFILTL